MQFGTSDQTCLEDLFRWRRDVRHFQTSPVPETVMSALKDCLALAPSVGNARPWRVLRVRDPARRQAVRGIFERCNEDAARGYEEPRQSAYRALKLAGLVEAPEHLAIFTDPDPIAGAGLGRQTMPETLQYSTVMAIHTLWLTARAHNVGVGWVSILDPQAVCAALGAPKPWRFTAYLCIGYPREPHAIPELHRTGWQENTATEWSEC